MHGKQTELNHWKGLALGVVGGVAGVLAMQYYWQAVTALTGQDPRKATTDAGPHALDNLSLVGQQHEADESSTAAVGRLLNAAATGKEEPKKETKATLSTLVHWGYSLTVAGLYGAVRGGTGVPDAGGGLVYGTGLWLFGSELAVPLLGLADGPTTQPLASHAHGLGAHVVYGLATAATTQVLYRLL